MTIENLGISFLPRGGAPDLTGPTGARLEDILRVLSFRLPRILGARPIAPQQLLQAGFDGPGRDAPQPSTIPAPRAHSSASSSPSSASATRRAASRLRGSARAPTPGFTVTEPGACASQILREAPR